MQQTKDSNTVLVSTLDSTIRLFDKGNGQLLKRYRGHANQNYRIWSCLGLGDAVIVSGSEDGYLYAWDLLEGKLVEKLEAHSGKVASVVAWNSNKKEWASAGADGRYFYPDPTLTVDRLTRYRYRFYLGYETLIRSVPIRPS